MQVSAVAEQDFIYLEEPVEDSLPRLDFHVIHDVPAMGYWLLSKPRGEATVTQTIRKANETSRRRAVGEVAGGEGSSDTD